MPPGEDAEGLSEVDPISDSAIRSTVRRRSPDVALPALGPYLKHLRRQAAGRRGRGMSRAELAAAAEDGGSYSYIIKLERGTGSAPSPQVVESLARALGATAEQTEHLHDLALYRPDPLPAAVATSIDGETRKFVDALPAIGGLVDDAWNVVYPNAAYRRVFRHIADPDVGNVLLWLFFVPDSRLIMVEWEDEALLTVSWLRALMVRSHRALSVFRSLLERLAQSAEFRAMWNRMDVALVRRTPEMLVRDLDRGTTLHLRAQVLTWPGPGAGLRLYLGVDVGGLAPDG